MPVVLAPRGLRIDEVGFIAFAHEYVPKKVVSVFEGQAYGEGALGLRRVGHGISLSEASEDACGELSFVEGVDPIAGLLRTPGIGVGGGNRGLCDDAFWKAVALVVVSVMVTANEPEIALGFVQGLTKCHRYAAFIGHVAQGGLVAHDNEGCTGGVATLDLVVKPGALFGVHVAAAAAVQENEGDALDFEGVIFRTIRECRVEQGGGILGRMGVVVAKRELDGDVFFNDFDVLFDFVKLGDGFCFLFLAGHLTETKGGFTDEIARNGEKLGRCFHVAHFSENGGEDGLAVAYAIVCVSRPDCGEGVLVKGIKAHRVQGRLQC